MTSLLLLLIAFADQTTIRAKLIPIEKRLPAPAFATPADYRGKVVLLDFWATWCTGCKQEIPWFIELEKAHHNAGLEVVGVSLDEDGWKALTPYLAEHPIPYRIVLGDEATAKRYQIEGMPDTFLIDKQGRIAATYRAGIVDKNDLEANIEALLAEPS